MLDEKLGNIYHIILKLWAEYSKLMQAVFQTKLSFFAETYVRSGTEGKCVASDFLSSVYPIRHVGATKYSKWSYSNVSSLFV